MQPEKTMTLATTTMDAESPKRSATRKALVDAAFHLFQQRGFDKVTIDDIAALAGVSRRTFFRYYPSKEAVVYPYSEQRIKFFHDMTTRQTGGGRATIEDIRVGYAQMVKLWLVDIEQMKIRRRLISSSQSLIMYDLWVTQLWADSMTLLLAGMPYGTDVNKADVESRLLAGAIIGSLRHAFAIWQHMDGDADLAALGDQAIRWIATGYGEGKAE